MKSVKYNIFAAASLAAVIVFLVFLRSIDCGFVNFDDPIFVQNNPFIRHLDGELLSWAFSSRTLDLMIPLTWISFALDYHIWGLNPLGFHLTNVLLHAVNTSMVALIAYGLATALSADTADASGLDRLRWHNFWIALIAALIFGIHPLRVESVAWITERKDVLNGLFTLASVYFYLLYTAKVQNAAGRREYLLSLALFICSLLAKPVSVGLPLLLMVLDWYPLRRLNKNGLRPAVQEKIPYFVVSISIGTLTIYLLSQRHFLVGLGRLSLSDRVLLSGNAVFEYCRLLLFPVGILPYYELPDSIGGMFVLKCLSVIAATGICLLLHRRRSWLLAGWLCFLLPVIPVLAFLQNNDVALAARYTYLPSVAPSLVAAFCALALFRRIHPEAVVFRRVAVSSLILMMFFYGATTWRLIGTWHDTESLWTRQIELQPATTKYMDRGTYYIINGHPDAAAADFTLQLEWLARMGKAPDHNAYAFRGVANLDLNRYEAAVADLTAALALKRHPTYYYYRGLALQALGRDSEAAKDFELAGPAPPPIDTF